MLEQRLPADEHDDAGEGGGRQQDAVAAAADDALGERRHEQTEKGDRARDVAFYEAGSTYDPSFDATSNTEVFLGWYTESGELLTDLTATENRTVYAQWESDFYD